MVSRHQKQQLMRKMIKLAPGKPLVPRERVLLRPHVSPLMRKAELKFGQPIEQIVGMGHKGVDVARWLGVRVETITRWRRKLGLTQSFTERKNWHE